MKVNGVKHVGFAPYNVASNGMGERMVQSFKNCTKACKGSKVSMGIDITITLHSNGFNKSFDEVMGLKTFSSNAEFFEIIKFE